MRESFSFDAHYAQCIVEDNPAGFAMDTHGMGPSADPGARLFVAMYSTEMAVVSIKRAAGGKRVAKLTGQLGCATEAGTGEITVGFREAGEPAIRPRSITRSSARMPRSLETWWRAKSRSRRRPAWHSCHDDRSTAG
jgi:hypothetical protein